MENTATTTAAATYTLVAEDFGRGDAERMFARLGNAVVAVETTTRTDVCRGVERTITGFRITMRGGFEGLRNTIAHARAVDAGFCAFCA